MNAQMILERKALDKYYKDLDARLSVLHQKNDMLVRSHQACMDCTKEIQEIGKAMSALDRKDKQNQIALKALDDARVRLREESKELKKLFEAVNEDYENEEKKLQADLSRGPDKPPKLEPVGSVEGDIHCVGYVIYLET
jgi:seryl-tRNA synthetase